MKYLYQVDIECKDLALWELYDIVNLAEKYNMPELMEELKTQIVQNLVDVVDMATKHSHFEEVSSALLLSCAKYFKKTVGVETDKQMQFVLEKYAEDKERLALKLVSMVSGLPRTECMNCGEESCETGQPVLHQKMRIGLLVKANNTDQIVATQYWGGVNWSMKKFTVIEVQAPSRVKLSFKDGSFPPGWYSSWYYHGGLSYHQTLCYDC